MDEATATSDTDRDGMNRGAAFKKAQERFGDRGTVGRGRPHASIQDDCFFVGWSECGVWQWLGMGSTWAEAFANVKKVKTHYMDRLSFYA